jgi:hypothetical protein
MVLLLGDMKKAKNLQVPAVVMEAPDEMSLFGLYETLVFFLNTAL